MGAAQADLFDGSRVASTPMSRRSDPVTSHLAAAEHMARGKRGQHVAAVVEAVRKHPGNTSAELAPLCGLERHETARRTADAEHAGAIRKGEARKCTTSGRLAVTWWPA